MSQYSTILRQLSKEKFGEVLAASSRKARETYFHRHRIRAPQTRGSLALSSRKNEMRLELLQKSFAQNDDEELAEEILRIFLLLKHRPLLAAALDALGIAHEDGLTESDEVEKLAKLAPADAQDLLCRLDAAGVAPREDIVLYLKFMGAPLSENAFSDSEA